MAPAGLAGGLAGGSILLPRGTSRHPRSSHRALRKQGCACLLKLKYTEVRATPPPADRGLQRAELRLPGGPRALGEAQGLDWVPEAPTCCGRCVSAWRSPSAGCAAAQISALPRGGAPACASPRPGVPGAPPYLPGSEAESWLQERRPAEPRYTVTPPGVHPPLPRGVRQHLWRFAGRGSLSRGQTGELRPDVGGPAQVTEAGFALSAWLVHHSMCCPSGSRLPAAPAPIPHPPPHDLGKALPSPALSFPDGEGLSTLMSRPWRGRRGEWGTPS